MINLNLLSTKAFELDSAVLPRQFQATLNRSNKIILRNIKTGYRINLGALSNVTINGLPTSFENIRQLVYNFSCDCDDDTTNPEYKIFDITFSNTFQ